MKMESEKTIITASGFFPNNGLLPLILYHSVADDRGDTPPAMFEQLFNSNRWTGSWRNGIYPYHHYHSSAHEVLGIYTGSARVILGGDKGTEFDLKAGDVVIIPAGVAHKRLSSSSDFAVVGAYPAGTSPDMRYGKEEEFHQAVSRIASLPLPEKDPVYGSHGLVSSEWKGAE